MPSCESPEEAENSEVNGAKICSCFSIYSIIICSAVRSRQFVLLAADLRSFSHMNSTGRTEGLQLHTRSTSVHTNTCSTQTSSTRSSLYPHPPEGPGRTVPAHQFVGAGREEGMQINLHQERFWRVVAGQAIYPTSVERVVPGAPEHEIADARRLYPRRH